MTALARVQTNKNDLKINGKNSKKVNKNVIRF